MEENPQLYKEEAAAALRPLGQRVLWKPGKATVHLEKRKTMNHLPVESPLEEYNGLIQTLVREGRHQVYLYRFGSERYYAVRGTVQSVEWLVIATREGVVETAFPPDAIDEYLNRRGFVFIGTIQEVFA
jgi:hypothetical protein